MTFRLSAAGRRRSTHPAQSWQPGRGRIRRWKGRDRSATAQDLHTSSPTTLHRGHGSGRRRWQLLASLVWPLIILTLAPLDRWRSQRGAPPRLQAATLRRYLCLGFHTTGSPRKRQPWSWSGSWLYTWRTSSWDRSAQRNCRGILGWQGGMKLVLGLRRSHYGQFPVQGNSSPSRRGQKFPAGPLQPTDRTVHLHSPLASQAPPLLRLFLNSC